MATAIPEPPEEYTQGVSRPDPEAVQALAKLLDREPSEVANWFVRDDDEVLDVDGIAERLQLAPKTVYQLLRSGELPARKVGRQWRITVRALSNWLEQTADDD